MHESAPSHRASFFCFRKAVLSSKHEWFALADEEEVEVHEKKETKKGKAAAAVSDDEDDDSDSGDESDAVSEEYDPDVSDDDMAAPPSSADARRSQRERKAKTSRQLVLDSDDDCAADASPVSGKGKRASCDDLEEEIDKDDEMEVEADADADKDEPVGLTWPADVRRNRSSRSRSSRSLSGGSSTPASLSTMPRARNLPEQLSTMTMSGGSVKRGCSAIDRRSLQQNDTKRLCMDLSEAASKAGMSVDELHSLAAAEPAEEDPEAAEDIECMVCVFLLTFVPLKLAFGRSMYVACSPFRVFCHCIHAMGDMLAMFPTLAFLCSWVKA